MNVSKTVDLTSSHYMISCIFAYIMKIDSFYTQSSRNRHIILEM